MDQAEPDAGSSHWNALAWLPLFAHLSRSAQLDLTIEIFDLKRMLIGDDPPLYLLEIIFRTIVIYVYTLLLLRWLGSRTIGQLSTIEFLLVIALGSAVGDAMFYPDVPLLHALLVVTLVVLANKGLDILITRSKRAERVIDGVPEEVIRHGVLCRDFLDGTSLSSSELFQQLREHGIEHLGQVDHAYVETDGVITVFQSRVDRPGLGIVPPWEIEAPEEVDSSMIATALTYACVRCGTLNANEGRAVGNCSSCGHEQWTKVTTSGWKQPSRGRP